jgi:GH15 family glucan-1,4-alpha-glucosidase
VPVTPTPDDSGGTPPSRHRYPPIGDYAFLSDGHAAALVSRTASVDWCCLPRMDDASVFGRLLDWERGGYCEIVPTAAHRPARRYRDDTLVLVTEFEADGGEVRVIDCLTGDDHEPGATRSQLLRIVEGVRGRVEVRVTVAPRFDYAALRPWLRRNGEQRFLAFGGDDALDIVSDLDLELSDRHTLGAVVEVRAGQRFRLALTWRPPEVCDGGLPPARPDELDGHLDATVARWTQWAAQITATHDAAVRRSAIILKGLINEPTGAVAAAATTSLPEGIGTPRTWDYRCSWIRDSQFTVRSLGRLGCDDEAGAFRRFIERSAAGSADSLQVVYGLGGERRLTELELDLDGYAGSRPVRVGNAAAGQRQLDVYGYLLDLAWRWHRRGESPDDDYWRFLVDLVDTAAEQWTEPDRGIWEVRGDPRHFVHSKVMCWAALDRGLRLAEECGRRAPVRRWSRQRDAVREAVETEGYDRDRGVFVRAFGHPEPDAALLLLPSFDFVAYDDERMVRTTTCVRDELDHHGLLRRYRVEDGLPGGEGLFLACTFWLAECLARQGRHDEAVRFYDRAVGTGNDLGLFAEECDPTTGQALGNVPQGLTHLSHIAAALALADAGGPA